jgi:hypothetical protein
MRKKRPKVPFYPAYTNAYKHYHAENYSRHPNGDIELLFFESWLLSQGAQFHLRSPTMKNNRWFYFDNDEDMLLFTLKWSA